MADAFTNAKRSEAVQTRSAEFGTRSGRCGSEFPEIEVVAGDTEVFDNVRNDSARHIAGMPRKGDEAIRAEWIRIMPVAAGVPEMFTTDLAEASLQLTTIERGIFAHGSGGENKFVAEGRRDGASSFKERFQMRFRGLLKAKRGFAAVAPVRVTAGQERGFGNPHAVFILTQLHFRERNNHNARKLTCSLPDVKEDG